MISGQTINYKKYRAILNSMPAPIMWDQIPKGVKLDLTGLLAYAEQKGVSPQDLSDDEKNQFLTGGTVKSIQEQVQSSIRYQNLAEWNRAHGSAD